jgi:hypothetical protein
MSIFLKILGTLGSLLTAFMGWSLRRAGDEKEKARHNAEVAEKYKHEAQLHAEPIGSKRDIIERMRKDVQE